MAKGTFLTQKSSPAKFKVQLQSMTVLEFLKEEVTRIFEHGQLETRSYNGKCQL